MSISAAENPQLAAAMIASALAPTPEEATPPPVVADPLDTHVVLPGGYLTFSGDVVREAEVRELNGGDEEAISRAKGVKVWDTILQRGTVSIGGDKATPQMLDSMLIGDRDALLLHIRCATYGNELEMHLVCPGCREEQHTTFDLLTDVPTRELGDTQRVFDIALRCGPATVSLPTGAAQRSILSVEDKTPTELNTLLLAACVISLNDFPLVNVDSIRNLSVRDRATLVEAIAERTIGPRLDEVSIPCLSCSESISVPLSLGDLFRL